MSYHVPSLLLIILYKPKKIEARGVEAQPELNAQIKENHLHYEHGERKWNL